MSLITRDLFNLVDWLASLSAYDLRTVMVIVRAECDRRDGRSSVGTVERVMRDIPPASAFEERA